MAVSVLAVVGVLMAVHMVVGMAVGGAVRVGVLVLVGMGVLVGMLPAVLMGVLMIERIPEQLRGRIMGTQNALTTAAPSVGIMLAAVLTEYVSVNAAALVLLGAWGCAFAYGLAARPLRTLEPQAVSVNAGGVR